MSVRSSLRRICCVVNSLWACAGGRCACGAVKRKINTQIGFEISLRNMVDVSHFASHENSRRNIEMRNNGAIPNSLYE